MCVPNNKHDGWLLGRLVKANDRGVEWRFGLCHWQRIPYTMLSMKMAKAALGEDAVPPVEWIDPEASKKPGCLALDAET